jgi:hypothetical protein
VLTNKSGSSTLCSKEFQAKDTQDFRRKTSDSIDLYFWNTLYIEPNYSNTAFLRALDQSASEDPEEI